MSAGRLALLRWDLQRRWIEPALVGAALGFALVAADRLGFGPALGELASRLFGTLNRAVGPVWAPMLLACVRVAWLAGRALQTRDGRGRLGEPVRPELGQIAPVFAALGLCGTVWGLSRAFEALNGGDFLSQLPLLLGGLGAAMTSTLVGLGLQIGTLLVGLFLPAWSWLAVRAENGDESFSLDRRRLGTGEAGLRAVLEGLSARAPEAVCVAFDRRLPRGRREEIRLRLWQRIDGATRLREITR
jgi:hypothetical protein